ncbi:MAG: Rrf2 family transcriptional regulator [Victivallales bacterium]|nr:Rrf2 family transcriptional regulator [Victivallales bacterium]MBR4219857.1 Rrf2 family transcriptional regulator [Victivallales bacterium]
MKISTKGRYGLRILIDLATHDTQKPRLVRDIAESQQISEKYISRLIIDLRRARLVRSVRGVKGGFFLARSPKEITLLDILETMEGTLSIVDCVMAPEKCTHNADCTARGIWQKLNDGIRELMRNITFEQILEEYRNGTAKDGVFDYCI